MANDVRQSKRKKQRGGVPTALVILLLVIAIAMGGMAGFVIARRTAPADNRLEQANERIIELENTLNLIGFPMDADPEDWVFDDTPTSDGTEDLAGNGAEPEDGESELWTDDDGLLTGTLNEDSDPVVVAEFDGGQLLSTEVIPRFNDQLTTQIFSGFSAEEVSDSVLQTVLSEMAGEKLIAQKAAEQGLDQITDEDLKRIEAEADDQYNQQISYYMAFVTEEGMTPSEVRSAAEAYMRRTSDVTRESIVEALKAELPVRKYYDYIVKDVTVSDEDIQAHYEERLADQKAAYADYPEDYESDHIEGLTLVYNPEGYRAVRDLLLPFEDLDNAEKVQYALDEIAAMDPETDAKRINELEKQLNTVYSPLEAKAAEITEKLKAGESFLSLMDQYGADELMQAEPLRTEGYYISDQTYLFSTEFIQGSMILERPGQVSTPLRSGAGLHLVEYVADIAPGEVPLSDVYDAMKAETLKIHQDAYYENYVSGLLDEANVQYYPERLQ